jgi:hypothetical protein
LGSDGILYGSNSSGGTASQGTFFRVNRDGSRPHILHEFMNRGGDGGAPMGVLLEGSDGAVYGITSWGGQLSLGTVFRLVPPPEVASERRSGGITRVTARTLAGGSVAIEASTNLASWSAIAGGTASNTVFTTEDPASLQHRFYRARRN